MDYTLLLHLNKFRGATEVMEVDGDGEYVRGIFIPLRKNSIQVSRWGNAILQLSMIERSFWDENGSHLLVERQNSDIRADILSENGEQAFGKFIRGYVKEKF